MWFSDSGYGSNTNFVVIYLIEKIDYFIFISSTKIAVVP